MADTLKQEKIKHEDVAADGVQAKPTVNKTTKRDEAAPPVKNETADKYRFENENETADKE